MARTLAELPAGSRITDYISLGVIAKYFPAEKIHEALQQTNRASVRERDLPAHVVVYYVIALALYMRSSYREVLRCLLEGMQWLLDPSAKVKVAGKSGISQARSRLGAEPLKKLYDAVVGPIAEKRTKGAWYRQWRLVSLDGSTLDVADTAENDKAFGRPGASRGSSAFPKIRFVALLENGTHLLWGAHMDRYATDELTLAEQVIPSLRKGMLCMADRFFPSYKLWRIAARTGADLLWRTRQNARLDVEQRLPDGSYLSRIYASTKDRRKKRNGIVVRVIDYRLKNVADAEPLYRLITTILDAQFYVLHLFFQLDAEPGTDAGFQFLDQGAEIGGGAGAGVVEEVGVVGGHMDVATPHALGAHLVQEPGSRDLALAHRRWRNPIGRAGRQVAQQEVLENAAGALHRDRKFLVAHGEDIVRRTAQPGRVGWLEQELGGEDDPLLVTFENAFAIEKLALRVVEDAAAFAIEEAHLQHAFGNGMAVGAGVAVDRGADGTGNAGEGFETHQAAGDSEVDQVLQHGAGIGYDAVIGCPQAVAAVTQDDAPITPVGHDEVGAVADHGGIDAGAAGGGDGGHEGFHTTGFGIEVGGAADTEAGVEGKGRAGGDGQVGDLGEAGARLFRVRHHFNYRRGGWKQPDRQRNADARGVTIEVSMAKFFIGLVTGVVVVFLTFILLFFALLRFRESPPEMVDNSVLVLRLAGDIPEKPPIELPAILGGSGPGLTVTGVWLSLKKAAADRHIKALVLEPEDLSSGWAKLEEFRADIEQFRKSGKPVYAYLRSPGGREYYVATAADRIYLGPSDPLMLKGMRAEILYFKNSLEKLGVTVEVEHAGKYKDFGDMFTRTDMSPETREVMTSVVDDLYGNLVARIAAARKKSPEEVRAIIDRGPFTAQQALQAGLVDALRFEDQMFGELKQALHLESEPVKVSLGKYLKVPLAAAGIQGKSRIAMIVGEGDIIRGSPDDNGADESSLTSYGFNKLLKQVEGDSSIKGVVVRIDSPGGEVTASDEIWRQMNLLSKKKPLVISMSDVAASGGYYMAMTGDPIVAYPGTLTGSIGVVFGKPVLRGLAEKLGVSADAIQRGKNADIDSVFTNLSPEERDKLRGGIEESYEDFVKKVADARHRSPAQILPVAQGRVWLGEQARTNGLVDELGGIDAAIQAVKKRANIPASEQVSLMVYPPRRNILDVIMKRSSPEDELETKLARVFGRVPFRAWMKGGLLRIMPQWVTVE